MLHASVPSEIASMPAAAVVLPTSVMPPTITSGPVFVPQPPPVCMALLNVPVNVVPAPKAPICTRYTFPAVALNVIEDCRPQLSSLHDRAVPADGQPGPGHAAITVST